MMGFSGSEIILLALFSAVGVTNAKFGIVEPFPLNVYPIKYGSTQVTCVAYDASGVKVPKGIQFVRKNQFAVYTNITASANIYFTNRTEDNGRKLSVTFHIRNVTDGDDSRGQLGRYECHAFAVGDPAPHKYGFSINVIQMNEIPKVVASKDNVLEHGGEVSINCTITDKGGANSKLKRISWFKDGEMLETVKNPNPAEPKDTLGALNIKNAGVKDGGRYTCLLEVLLRDIKGYNVSDSTLVKIAPWLEQLEGETESAKTGEKVTLQCSARGFPLNVEWKVKKDSNETVEACVDSSTDKRYKIERKGMYDPYFLSVTNLSTTDSGNYYCCLPSNCSANIEDRCQRFTLTVTDDVLSHGSMALASRGVLLAMLAFLVSCYHF